MNERPYHLSDVREMVFVLLEADKRGFSVTAYAEMENEIKEENPPSFGL